MQPVSKRRNVQYHNGRRRRLPDVPGLTYEREWWDQGAVVAGFDEVGCGSWAGPVTYGAVVLPSDRRMYKLRDSKVLDPERREELAGRIRDFATAYAVGHASNLEVDALGLAGARRLAAWRALEGLELRPDVCLLDGKWNFLSAAQVRTVRIVGGDARSASVAAASIVAKVVRDALMTEVCPRYPPYGFSRNKGYPSPEHKASLAERGPCDLHRRTWAPIVALRQGRLPLDDEPLDD